MLKVLRSLLILAPVVSLAVPASGQANEDPAIDVYLAKMKAVAAMGRQGAYPNGMNGLSISTTACNTGTKTVTWKAPMNAQHPFIAFMILRESNGRFEQISDRSHLKHTFYALTSTDCGSCTRPPGPSGAALGLGCSDTYSTSNNGDRYYLGPQDEVDPWLGTWDPACSYLDSGDPAASSPFDCDGVRSLTYAQVNQMSPIENRQLVSDADLQTPGATYYFTGHYVIESEGDAKREDSMGSRQFNPSWNGNKWILGVTGAVQNGSVLNRWTGATVDSNTNGNDDGRVYVAVNVTGPTNGMYHYEYAFHNRDNNGGIDGIHIPVCSGARVTNLGFKDIDGDPLNDWAPSMGTDEIVVSTPDNPLRWNSVFNVWFDSDAAPVAGATVTLDQDGSGVAAPTFGVTSSAPLGLYNQWLGAGCSGGTVPDLYATGAPAQATIGNASFAVESTGNVALQTNVLFLGWIDGSLPLGGGCTQWMGGLLDAGMIAASTVLSDGSGIASHPLPIPADAALEGAHVNVQAAGLNPGAGALLGLVDLSDGLRVRIGDSIVGCP